MFGYIRIAKPELKVKEYETYKAVYCALCRRLGKNYGLLSRLTLSYDFTFLALLQLSLRDGLDEFERKRCAFNPLKKCIYCKCGDGLELASGCAMIMLYYKILDNISDERGIRRAGYIMLKPLFSHAHKKAAAAFPEAEKIIAGYIDGQKQLENDGCRDLDRAADPTAQALSGIFSLCSTDPIQKRVLSRLGYCMGRYIYLLDAACDYAEDEKKSRYNPLHDDAAVGNDGFPGSRVKPQLYLCVNEAGKAFELLDVKKYGSILANIIYIGMEDTFTKELSK